MLRWSRWWVAVVVVVVVVVAVAVVVVVGRWASVRLTSVFATHSQVGISTSATCMFII